MASDGTAGAAAEDGVGNLEGEAGSENCRSRVCVSTHIVRYLDELP